MLRANRQDGKERLVPQKRKADEQEVDDSPYNEESFIEYKASIATKVHKPIGLTNSGDPKNYCYVDASITNKNFYSGVHEMQVGEMPKGFGAVETEACTSEEEDEEIAFFMGGMSLGEESDLRFDWSARPCDSRAKAEELDIRSCGASPATEMLLGIDHSGRESSDMES